MKKFKIYHWITSSGHHAYDNLTLDNINDCVGDSEIIISQSQKRYYIPRKFSHHKKMIVYYLEKNIDDILKNLPEGDDKILNIPII